MSRSRKYRAPYTHKPDAGLLAANALWDEAKAEDARLAALEAELALMTDEYEFAGLGTTPRPPRTGRAAMTVRATTPSRSARAARCVVAYAAASRPGRAPRVAAPRASARPTCRERCATRSSR